jgi:hypothetical protein
MSGGPAGLIAWLLIVSVVMVLVFAVFVRLVGIDRKSGAL